MNGEKDIRSNLTSEEAILLARLHDTFNENKSAARLNVSQVDYEQDGVEGRLMGTRDTAEIEDPEILAEWVIVQYSTKKLGHKAYEVTLIHEGFDFSSQHFFTDTSTLRVDKYGGARNSNGRLTDVQIDAVLGTTQHIQWHPLYRRLLADRYPFKKGDGLSGGSDSGRNT